MLGGCGPAQQSSRFEEHRIEGPSLGTTYHIAYLSGSQPVEKQDVQQRLRALFAAGNQSMSTYHPDSEISVFNRSRSTDPVAVSADLREVIIEGIRLNEVTAGSLDITLKPLSAIWGFGPEGRPHTIPDDKAITDAKAITGVDKLLVKGQLLAKTEPLLQVDLNTIGKGFVVDQVAQLLESLAIDNYMVEIGGEMRLKGHNGKGKKWRVGVINPVSGQPTAQLEVYPGNNGMATSGDYYQYFEQDGVRYSHILDPLTGKPIKHNVASVTVIHPKSMTADGLSTAMMVMGEEKGLALAEKHQFAVYMIIRQGDHFVSKMSSTFAVYLKQ